MRNAFASEITALAQRDERIVLLSGDIGNRLFDEFKANCPGRFFNCGIAEANMIGVAAGMAMNGLRPIVYTITPFITARCLEQIRLDTCYHHLPVTIAGVGSGLCYASLGATHHSCEDIAMLRVLPNMTVVCPADAHEVRAALRESSKLVGPMYLRLGKKGEPVIHQTAPVFEIGKALNITKGSDICLLSCGNILPVCIQVAEALSEHAINAELTSFHTVKPLDQAYLESVFSSFRLVVTIEEHSRIAGFGSAVAEWCSDQKTIKAKLLRFGTRDEFIHEAGSQSHARKYFGLTVENIVEQILRY